MLAPLMHLMAASQYPHGVAAPITNLLPKSQQFDNAAWTKTRLTITADQTTAPDGTTTADLLTEDATTNFRILQPAGGFTVLASTGYTISVYAKMGTLPFIQLTDSGGNYFANFDIQNGVVGTKSGCTSFIVSVGNGWYRLVVNRTTGAAETSTNVFIMPTNSASAARAASYLASSRTAYVWQAQYILGTYADGGNGTVTV